ncbi:MAG: efflux RND transporter periplasmic adaptor subunit [Phycisphaeraceae bacterium]|nr:efflux RND transporter periplasmic adaptor subunit [Phycisphaeraceae bacterium]
MNASFNASRITGLIVGLVIAGSAIIWALTLRGRAPAEPKEPMVRPLLVVPVGTSGEVERRFPARVRATSEANLAFEVSGVVRTLPIVRGQRVKSGDLLAELDLRDFQSRLASAEASLAQQVEEVARRQRAFDQGAATEMEMIRARAALDSAQAARDIAVKALEDATLRAPFDGIIADVFVDQFQNVTAGAAIARIQGGEGIRVEINVDAGRVALARTLNEQAEYAVRFDFLPEREYPVKLVEFTTEADRATQTFRAFFQLEPQGDVVILPGMTATLFERLPPAPGTGGFSVPLTSVVHGDGGGAFVWVVDDSGQGVASVRQAPVQLGEVNDDRVMVTAGLTQGQRIAAAGVHHLVDGQRVRPVGQVSPSDLQ